jgi:probable HAF family extracellular repeat protein
MLPRTIWLPQAILTVALLGASAEATTLFHSTRLVIPTGATTYDVSALAGDGRAGGSVRMQVGETEYDLAAIWDSSGRFSSLPMPASYTQAFVAGFGNDGTPLGLIRSATEYPGPGGYWVSTGFVPLPDFGEGGVATAATGRLILGQTYELVPEEYYVGRATIWSADGVRHISGLEAFDSFSYAVNAVGAYVGVAIDRSDPRGAVYHGFIGKDGAATLIDYPEFNVTRAFDINDDGWFTGIWLRPGFARRAYVAREDEIRDLGLFPGYAESWAGAINNDGTIVGAAANFGLLARALVWFDGQPPMDLNTLVSDLPSGTVLTDAYDINNAGQILARANNGTYVLTPIPEPGTVALLATLLPALLTRRERNCRVRF